MLNLLHRTQDTFGNLTTEVTETVTGTTEAVTDNPTTDHGNETMRRKRGGNDC